jgi:hypothetical protein
MPDDIIVISSKIADNIYIDFDEIGTLYREKNGCVDWLFF